MIEAKKKPAREAAKQPSKYWRNRWGRRPDSNPNARFICRRTGIVGIPDEDGTALFPRIYPSREVAEEVALRVLKTAKRPAIYLGAVPCDQWGNPI